MKKLLAAVCALLLIFSFSVQNTATAAEGSSFKDVGGTFWAKDAIESLAASGVINGFKDHTFKPNASVTREEFATLITNAFYLDLPGDDVPQTFADVGKTRWSFKSIEAAKEFLTGYYPPSGKASFNPTAKATREDVAVALVKTLHYEPDDLEDPNTLDRFYDSDDISPNMRTYVALAVEKKLIVGNPDGTFKPANPVTRAESASLLFRAIKGAAGDSTQSLTLNVDAPETTSTPTFYVSGDVTKGAKVYINNKEVEVIQGAFRVGYRLEAEGTFPYTVSARLPGGKTQTVNKKVKYEQGAPSVTVKGVPDISDKQTLTVSWTVKDDNDPNPVVYVNGERQYSYSSSATITLEDGNNEIVVKAENSAGKSTEVVKRVVFQSGGPVLNIQDIPAIVDKDTLTLNWSVTDKNDDRPKVFINGDQLYGTSTSVTLKEGTNTFIFKAVNHLGKTTEVTKTVVLSGGAPTLTVDPLPAVTDKDSITVSWQVQDQNDYSPKVFVNGQEVYGRSTSVALKQGTNTITVRAVNKTGKITEVTKTVSFESGGPVLTVGTLASATDKKSVTVSWSVSDKNDNSPKVFVNGQQVFGSSNSFELKAGLNTFKIKAENRLGQTAEETREITFDPPAPVLTLGYAPETTASSSITLTWAVSDSNDYSPKVYLNDSLVYGTNQNVTLKPGANTFKIAASNSYGKVTEINYTVTYTPAP